MKSTLGPRTKKENLEIESARLATRVKELERAVCDVSLNPDLPIVSELLQKNGWVIL